MEESDKALPSYNHTRAEKVGWWNERYALLGMCGAQYDLHERSLRASGAIWNRQNFPLDQPEISFSFCKDSH